MKKFGYISFLVAGVLGSCSKGQELPPNVLLILTDDQGWGDFGFNGNNIVHTPTLDSLYHQSAHLTNYYVSPLSASTRAGILTGREHLRTGAMSVTRSSENMHSDELTLAEVFSDNGYSTGCFGKWHNGAHYPQDPNGQGFDEFVGFCSGHLTNYFDSRLQNNQEFFNADGYITDVLTNSALDFIQESTESNKPFFCYIPYNAPHAPYQVPDEYYDKYKSLKIEGDDMTAAVYAMCENVDYNISRILKYLADKQLDTNTLIVFMSDNGSNNLRYNGTLKGKKGEMYEGGFKVPCLFYWKGYIGALELPQTTSYIDIMPTILDICGLEYEQREGRAINGVSLKNIITGKETKLKNRYLYTHRSTTDLDLLNYNGVIYNDKYKLISFPNNKHELYDKLVDPSEKQNIFNEEDSIASSMAEQYNKWFADVIPEYERSISRTAQIGILSEPTELPAHEALMSGSTRYFTNIHGWAGDWLVDMSPEDSINWEVIVDTEADYEVTLQYSSTKDTNTVSINNGKAVKLTPFDAKTIHSPDRSPRVEAYEKEWGEQLLDTIYLSKGHNSIKLSFNLNSQIEKGSLEVKGVVVKKL